MQVTIEDEAKTQIRHIYAVSAPLAGRVLRISQHVGDQVIANETVVAVIQPTLPSFLDTRFQEELKAARAAADAAVNFAEAELQRLEAVLVYSRSELARTQALARSNAIAQKALDRAKVDVATNEAAVAGARAQLEIRRGERAIAAARLMDPTTTSRQGDPSCCIQVLAPITGRILRIIQESEAVVPAGMPLIEIGAPTDLEIVADLLSSDAVQIEPGASVRVDGWGGSPIAARVTRIDPAGFLKISALGIEEQRVRTIMDFTDPPEEWSRLGHDYRVIVHVSVWQADNVLVVPIGALFRHNNDWAAFAVSGGKVRIAPLQIGHRNDKVAEIISGLVEGDQVILYPSDRIEDGIRVTARPID